MTGLNVNDRSTQLADGKEEKKRKQWSAVTPMVIRCSSRKIDGWNWDWWPSSHPCPCSEIRLCPLCVETKPDRGSVSAWQPTLLPRWGPPGPRLSLTWALQAGAQTAGCLLSWLTLFLEGQREGLCTRDILSIFPQLRRGGLLTLLCNLFFHLKQKQKPS